MTTICVAYSSLLGQANPVAVQSFLAWAIELAGASMALIALVGLAIFVGACVVVAKSQRLAVIASYLVLLPLPLMLASCAALKPQISALAGMAISSQAISPSNAQVAAGVAAALLPLFVALMVTWPSYLVLSAGLIFRAARRKRGEDG